MPCFGSHRRAESQAVDDGVERQTKGETDPAKISLRRQFRGMSVAVLMSVVVVTVLVAVVVVVMFVLLFPSFAMLVSMHMEHADEQEHRQQTAERPPGRGIESDSLGHRMRQ